MTTDSYILLAISYIFGSLPFGLILCALFGYGDIRKIGSGNIGATNVLRTGNKILALITLLLDSGKGAIAVGLCALFTTNNIFAGSTLNTHTLYVLCAFSAIIGHCFPVWLKFKGGKGVATTLGGLLGALPLTGLACCLVWLVSAFISRISSLSALIATAAAPLIAQYFYGDLTGVTLPVCGITVLVWAKHHANIRRIFKGEEPKIGKKKDKEKV